MKKISFIIATLAIMLGLSQCRKPDLSVLKNGGGSGEVTREITFEVNPDNSKSDITDDGANLLFKWEKDDVLYVYASKDNTFTNPMFVGKAKLLDEYIGSVNGEFRGRIDVSVDSGYKYLRVCYYGRGLVSSKDGDYPDEPGVVSFNLANEQDGTLAYLKNTLVAMGTTEIEEGQRRVEVDLKLPYSIMKLDLAFFKNEESQIKIDYVQNKIYGNTSVTQNSYKGITIDAAGKIALIRLEDEDLIYVKNRKSQIDSVYYVALWPGDEVVCRFSSGTKSESRMFNLEPDGYYTDDGKGKPVVIVDWVDFGAAGKWARYNLGVGENVGHKNFKNGYTDLQNVIYSWYGDYYAWGDTRLRYKGGKAQTAGENKDDWNVYGDFYGFTNDTYKHFLRYEHALEVYCKYVKTTDYYEIPIGIVPDNKTVIDTLNFDSTSDDAAYIVSVRSKYWMIPKISEWENLRGQTYWVRTDSYYNIAGLRGWIAYKSIKDEDGGKIVNINEKPLPEYDPSRNAHIFIPFAGFREGTTISEFNFGEYDTADRDKDVAKREIFKIVENNIQFDLNDFRLRGLSIRPRKVK